MTEGGGQMSEDRGQRTDIPVSNRTLCTMPYALCPMPINPQRATGFILLAIPAKVNILTRLGLIYCLR